MGGLGTAATRLAKIKGATVTAISRSAKKKRGCLEDGVDDFLLSSDEAEMAKYVGKFDLLIDCTPVNTDLGPWMELLKYDGCYCRVGIPSATNNTEFKYDFIPLIFQQKKIVGSIVTGTARMKLLLELASANPDVFKNKPGWHTQMMPFSKVNDAMDALQESKADGFRIILQWDL
jgi:uncharacterized zinc-type alcohol dehydrogenase-like protein